MHAAFAEEIAQDITKSFKFSDSKLLMDYSHAIIRTVPFDQYTQVLGKLMSAMGYVMECTMLLPCRIDNVIVVRATSPQQIISMQSYDVSLTCVSLQALRRQSRSGTR
eukprot:gnl/MRDRNA2_/MRDRNA2_842995_c0_seq1.p1 gnl/MRDRNA2_/MRDRNA2_842995_c0~~gnl/MRDRNA2_/MRDRNA2_842995_c0_seq1.p1  ORF type:complete len:108 (-),score=13.81 gnl/MRDRNA2_/MRDRNA2_842995_c0_seq1:17-340(-)